MKRRTNMKLTCMNGRLFARKGASPVLLACVVIVLVALALALAWFGRDVFAFFMDGQRLQAWVDAQGPLAPVAMAALITVQVVVAVLPGEPLELAAGYAFGFWEGTALCMIAGLVGTVVSVVLMRVFGLRLMGLFVSVDKIRSMKWLRDSARFELLLFVCFLIPGTPKDVMTYVAGMTKCPTWRIALITTIGRIPSIVSSTLAAGLAATGNWSATAVVLAITAVLALGGIAAYGLIARREKARAGHGAAEGVEGRAARDSLELPCGCLREGSFW